MNKLLSFIILFLSVYFIAVFYEVIPNYFQSSQVKKTTKNIFLTESNQSIGNTLLKYNKSIGAETFAITDSLFLYHKKLYFCQTTKKKIVSEVFYTQKYFKDDEYPFEDDRYPKQLIIKSSYRFKHPKEVYEERKNEIEKNPFKKVKKHSYTFPSHINPEHYFKKNIEIDLYTSLFDKQENCTKNNIVENSHFYNPTVNESFFAGWINAYSKLKSSIIIAGNIIFPNETYPKVETNLLNKEWFEYISKYKGLSQIIATINGKYHDIFSRLYKLQQHKKELKSKFLAYQNDCINYDKYLNDIDSDIQLLSSHGMRLANVSKKLFRTIKPIIIDAEMRMDTLSARQDSMEGLRSFEREMNRVSKLPQGAIDESIDEIVDSIDVAISKLEKALAK